MKRAIFVLLFVVGVAIRLPAIVQPLGVDQGIFAYAGRALLNGATIYRDFWDQNPPGIHLTYAVSLFFHDSPATVWFIDLLAALATTIVVWRLGRTLLRDSGAGDLAALVFLFGTWPAAREPLGGFLDRAVPVTFMSFWVSVSVLLLARVRVSAPAWSLLASGVSMGVAVAYEPMAVVPLISFAAWLTFASRQLPLVEILRRQALFIVGSIVPPLVVVAWLAWQGVAGDAWTAVVEYNSMYIAVGSSGPIAATELFVRELWRLVNRNPLWLLGAGGTIVAVHRAYVGETEAGLLVAWLGASGLAIVGNGGHQFSTHFLQAQPALALAGALPVLALWRCAEWSRRVRLTSRVVLVALVIVSLARSDFVGRGWNVLDADLSRLRGRLEDTQYLERFGGYAKGQGYSARANAELASYLKAASPPEERVFIFGVAPSVYYIADRRVASHYLSIEPVVSNLLPDHREFSLEALALELERQTPLYFILEMNNSDRFLGWDSSVQFARTPIQALVDHRYVVETTIEDFVVYRRKQ